MPWLSIATIASALVAGIILSRPAVARSELWRATVTPLASIIGSGFLILGPILVRQYGPWAPAMMVALCLGAYAFGAAIRFNILHVEPNVASLSPNLARLETASSGMLALAYIVSVTYYLNLLGSFAVSLTPLDSQLTARLVTTVVLTFIGAYGFWKGLSKLEVLEQVAVTLKLSIIAGLLVALGYFVLSLTLAGSTATNTLPPQGLNSLFVAFGLVVTVQGFETSRYLGEVHDAKTRIRTMKYAQWASSGIYVAYVTALTWSFNAGDMGASETAIIGVTERVAPVLPLLLVVAALAAQFSAAVADTAGCGGLVQELSKGRVHSQTAYVVVMVAGLALTWTTDIFDIIAWASRAFALYYALQSAVAATCAYRNRSGVQAVSFGILGVLGFAMAVLGVSAEGS